MDLKIAGEMKRKLEHLKRDLDSEIKEKQKISAQFQSLVKVFSLHRKALEVSILKNKKY